MRYAAVVFAAMLCGNGICTAQTPPGQAVPPAPAITPVPNAAAPLLTPPTEADKAALPLRPAPPGTELPLKPVPPGSIGANDLPIRLPAANRN